jgi:hypothetical protein
MPAIPDVYAEETSHAVDVRLPQLIDNDAAVSFPNHHGWLLVQAAVLEQGMPEVPSVRSEQVVNASRIGFHRHSRTAVVAQSSRRR